MLFDEALPSTGFNPVYLSNVPSWHRHLPFAYDLVAHLKPKQFVELGVHYGDSYFTFCQSVKDHGIECNCHGIDTWKGDHHAGLYGEEVWEMVKHHNDSNFKEFSTLARESFLKAASRFKDQSIDLLHIDGLHTYEAVREDFTTWIGKVTNGGIVLFHDVEEKQNDFGVWKFWKELQKEFPTVNFEHGHGLGVLFNQPIGEPVSWYLDSYDSKRLGNLYYRVKGENVRLRKQYFELENSQIENESSSKELTNELNEFDFKCSELEKAFHESMRQNLILRDKVKRIQNSFSWNITYPLRFLRRALLDPLLRSFIGNRKAKRQSISFNEWVEEYDTIDENRLKLYLSECEQLTINPLISIVVPIHKVSVKILEATIDSVKEQVYQNWELILIDDCSHDFDLKQKILLFQASDYRIKAFFRDVRGNIAQASNEGINRSAGSYILFLDHDDLLRNHSLLRIVQAIESNSSLKLIYSDEDKINILGRRTSPNFKPSWNPDLLLSQNYICHLLCVEANVLKQVSGFREGYEGCQDWDLVLRITERLNSQEIHHIPEILYHWRKSGTSTATSLMAKPYVAKNSLKVIESALQRRGVSAQVHLTSEINNYIKIEYEIRETHPLVSIIIPTRDQLSHLQKCIDGVLKNTNYPDLEILVCDNDSEEISTLEFLNSLDGNPKIRVLRIPGPFNYSRINNQAVSMSKGDMILFLNNDVEAINEDWLKEIVSHALRPEIGCVGAKLLYPNNTIQHAGVVLGIGGVAGHAFRAFPHNHSGYMGRLNLVQNYSAVTAACMMVRKSIFLQSGGFDEENLKVAFNDVDLCLKIKKLGYRNLWTPYAQLFHHESASRGNDLSPANLKRYTQESDYLKSKWSEYVNDDPSYNPNLTYDREDFTLGEKSCE
ncbi:MAG: glycosyltransferase [Opitutales bacterium]|nr:glycosyltransferase [Opitutales bacterium]